MTAAYENLTAIDLAFLKVTADDGPAPDVIVTTDGYTITAIDGGFEGWSLTGPTGNLATHSTWRLAAKVAAANAGHLAHLAQIEKD